MEFLEIPFDQKLQINAEKFLELDDENIPTGNFIPMETTLLILEILKCSGWNRPLFCFKNNTEPASYFRKVKNGLTMKVYTDQPAVQIYVGGKT